MDDEAPQEEPKKRRKRAEGRNMTFGMPPKLANAVRVAANEWGSEFCVSQICRDALVVELKKRKGLSRALEVDGGKGLAEDLDALGEKLKALKGMNEVLEWRLGRLAAYLERLDDHEARLKVLEARASGPFA